MCGYSRKAIELVKEMTQQLAMEDEKAAAKTAKKKGKKKKKPKANVAETSAKYGVSYFDIYSNDETAEFLKAYADWPFFPQLWVKGEFVGGGDVLQEMKDSGELLEVVREILRGESE